MNEMMKKTENMMNDFVTDFGIECDYTIEVAKAYEVFLNNPTNTNYFDFTLKVCEMLMIANAEMKEE